MPPQGAPEPALVLIVEDEEPLAETIAYIVQETGYTALVALHGREALELARARRPALLITDLMLPHLDGTALIAALRADAAEAGEAALPIILITVAGLVQAREAGADVILRKPFVLADLEALLRRFLEPPPANASTPTPGSLGLVNK
jgi:DNA-binding response OmpR family regulator